MFSEGNGQKPLAGEWGTATQIAALLPFLEIDETFLRNRSTETNPRTAAPWIPKAVNRQFHILRTLCGLLEWFHAKAAEKDGLPSSYASQLAMENATGLSKKAIKFLLKNGAGEAQDKSSRIDPRPILKQADHFLCALADGTIDGIEGMPEYNKDRSAAQLMDEQAAAIRRKALMDEGEMLLSRDGDFAISKLVADELIWEKMWQPWRAQLLALPKNINRQHRTVLNGDEPLPEKIRKSAAVVTSAVAEIFNKIREKKPKRIAVGDGEK